MHQRSGTAQPQIRTIRECAGNGTNDIPGQTRTFADTPRTFADRPRTNRDIGPYTARQQGPHGRGTAGDKESGLGEHLRHAIRAAGLTPDEFADLLGVNPKTVGRWVRGVSAPQRHNQIKIARALNLPVDDLWPDGHPPADQTSGTPSGGSDAAAALSEVTGTWGSVNDPAAPGPLSFITVSHGPIDALLLVADEATLDVFHRQAQAGRHVRLLFTQPQPPLPDRVAHPHLEIRTAGPCHYQLVHAGERMLLALSLHHESGHALLELTRTTPGGIFDRFAEDFQTLWENAQPNACQRAAMPEDEESDRAIQAGRQTEARQPGRGPAAGTSSTKDRHLAAAGRPRLWPRRTT